MLAPPGAARTVRADRAVGARPRGGTRGAAHQEDHLCSSRDGHARRRSSCGVGTARGRDANGNLLSQSVIPAGGGTPAVTAFTYGDVSHPGDVTKITDPLSRTTTVIYDAGGLPSSVTDPLSNETVTYFNAAGVPVQSVSAAGRVTDTALSSNRVSQIAESDGSTIDYTYNTAGRVSRTQDSDGTRVDYTYDADGKVLTETHSQNGSTLLPRRVITFTYDSMGRRLTMSEHGRTTTWTYDNLGRVATEDLDGRVTTYTYDAAGQLTTVVRPDASETSYDFDEAGQLEGIAYDDATPDVTFGYDTAGRRDEMTDGTGTTTWSYDPFGRLSARTDGAAQVTEWGWDLAGQLTTITYPGDADVTRSYDAAGRLESVTDWDANTWTFAYDADGLPTTTTWPNGVTGATVRGDDPYLDPTSGYDGPLPTWISYTDSTSAPFADIFYEREENTADASVLSESATSSDQFFHGPTYEYDSLDRVAQLGGAATRFDAEDSLAALPTGVDENSLTYDTAYQLDKMFRGADSVTVEYGFDANARRVSETPDDLSPVTSYSWNAADRLTEAAVPAGTVGYAYDGTGNLASRTESAATDEFVWDTSGSLPLLLDDGDFRYIYGPLGTPVAQVDGAGTVLHMHPDALGSVRYLTDDLGALVGSRAYDPWGTPVAGSTGASRFGFAGEWADPTTELIHLRARWYDPATGQLLSLDPLYASTGDRYGYGRGNPTRWRDPSGLFPGEGLLDAIGDVAGDIYSITPNAQALRFISAKTGYSVGLCVGFSVVGGYDAMGAACYMATPDGDSGFTLTAGAGGGAPVGGSGLLGLSVSNAQSCEDFDGRSNYMWGSAGEGPLGAGGSHSWSDSGTWQTTAGWAPGFNLPAPFSFGAGSSSTLTPGW